MNQINKKEKRKLDIVRYIGIFILIAIIIPIVAFLMSTALAWWTSVFLNKYSIFEDQGGIVADLTSGVLAAIAAGLVLFQLRQSKDERVRQNDIEEASFLLQLNQTFIQDSNMAEIESRLESVIFYKSTLPIISDEQSRQKVVNYLAYFDGLAPLILRGVLGLKYIDDLMAYRFYIAVNNKEIQEKELLKFPGDYRGCFKLYKKWTAYRKEQGLQITCEENALDCWEHFHEYANDTLSDSITIKQLDEKYTLTDNQVAEIAELIYDTDPDIYPVLFAEKDNTENNTNKNLQDRAGKVISAVLRSGNDTLFNKKNLFICIHEMKIIGLIHWVRGQVRWSPEQFCHTAKEAGVLLNEQDVCFLGERYFCEYGKEDPEAISLINICVKSKYRHKGIGTIMMRQFVSKHDNERLVLSVVQNNKPAIKLYSNNGFKTTGSYVSDLFSDVKIQCSFMSRDASEKKSETNSEIPIVIHKLNR